MINKFEHKMKKAFIIIIVLFSSFFSFGQQPSDNIDVESFNQQYLEHLTKTKLDSVREANGLKPLFNDSILYLAAEDHALYLLINKKSGSLQMDSLKRTTTNRIHYFGGKNYVAAENAVTAYVHKKIKRKPIRDKKGRVVKLPPVEYHTYEQLANGFVSSWIKNEKFTKVFLLPEWRIIGLSIQLNKETKQLKADQIFGYQALKYAYKENKTMFPYSEMNEKYSGIESFTDPRVTAVPYEKKLPHKLKAPKKMSKKMKEFISMVQQADFYKSHRGVFIDMVMMKPELVSKIFKKKKNGVAIEIVEYAPYACGNDQYYLEQSRRNKKSVIKGNVLKPVYRDELLRGFIPDQTQKHTATIGVDPRDYTSPPEFNILFLYNKKVVYVMHFTGPCGDPFELYTPQELVEDLTPGKLEFPTSEDSITIKVDYKRNQVKLDSTEFQALRDSVPEEQIKIHRAVINAFSSIEGTEKINLRLMKERTQNMLEAIQPYIQDSTKVEQNAAENWDEFYSQIKGTKFAKMGKLSKEQLKEMLSDTIKRKVMDDLLYQQRVAEIKMWYTARVKDSASYILNYYNELVNGMKYRKKASDEEITELNACFDFLFKSYQKGTFSQAEFEKLPIADKEGLEDIAGNHAWAMYESKYKKDSTLEPSSDFLNHLEFAAMGAKGKAVWKYNYLVYYLDKWTEEHPARTSPAPEEMQEILDSLIVHYDGTNERVDLLKLQLNFHFKAAYYYYQNYDFENRDRSAMFLFNYYAPQQLSEEIALKLGRAFTNMVRGDLAAMLLNKYASKVNPNKEILALYLKLLYRPVDNGLDKEYFKLLMDSYLDLGKEHWCELFLSQCSISFQAFDYEELRKFYCEKCADRVNNATKYLDK